MAIRQQVIVEWECDGKDCEVTDQSIVTFYAKDLKQLPKMPAGWSKQGDYILCPSCSEKVKALIKIKEAVVPVDPYAQMIRDIEEGKLKKPPETDGTLPPIEAP